MKQHFLQKREGVTLVEVLISLIILSVVTVSLLAFFQQVINLLCVSVVKILKTLMRKSPLRRDYLRLSEKVATEQKQKTCLSKGNEASRPYLSKVRPLL